MANINDRVDALATKLSTAWFGGHKTADDPRYREFHFSACEAIYENLASGKSMSQIHRRYGGILQHYQRGLQS